MLAAIIDVTLTPVRSTCWLPAAGKLARLTGPAGSAVVRLIDCCPECKIGDIDTTQSVFQKVVGPLSVGRQKITWEFVS